MEEKIYIGLNKIRDKKPYKIITGILFPAILVFISFFKVNKGLDITDSAYSCTNFLSLDRLDCMWYYSTFYANLIGGILTRLPYGNTLIGLNCYTSLFKLALALFAYFFFYKSVKIKKELSFFGVLVSLCLCWCPVTILYNYLTYFLFFLGTAFLYSGLMQQRKGYFLIAGFLLGSNFFVRLPNVVEAGLIAAVWGYSIFNKESFKECLNKTLHCIYGYLIAFILGAFLIACTRGFKAYFQGIKELFFMTDEAPGYSAPYMLWSIIEQYLQTFSFIEISIFMLLLCLLTFLVLPKRLTWLRYIVATFVTGGFVIFMYKKGLFTFDCTWFGPVYRIGILLFTVGIVWMAVVIIDKRNLISDRLLALMALLSLFITPIGSNNEIYANLNNLFFFLPVMLHLIVRFVNTNEYVRGIRLSVLLLTGVFSLLSIFFFFNYMFRDSVVPELDSYVENNEVCVGVKTAPDNAARLRTLTDFWRENNLSDGTVLLYGSVCGLGFYLNTPIAISTAWPSLGSFVTDKFETEINNLAGRISEKGEAAPSIIIDLGNYNELTGTEPTRKQEILKDFIEEFKYEIVYTNEVLVVLTASK